MSHWNWERVGPERGLGRKIGLTWATKNFIENEVYGMRSLQNERPSKHSLNQLEDIMFICFRALNDIVLCVSKTYISLYIYSATFSNKTASAALSSVLFDVSWLLREHKLKTTESSERFNCGFCSTFSLSILIAGKSLKCRRHRAVPPLGGWCLNFVDTFAPHGSYVNFGGASSHEHVGYFSWKHVCWIRLTGHPLNPRHQV